MRVSRILGWVWYTEPVERGQRKNVDGIILNRIVPKEPSIACADEAKPMISNVSENWLVDGQLVYISNVPFVELMPAVQKDILGLGAFPVVV